jgi:hypothetical protein
MESSDLLSTGDVARKNNVPHWLVNHVIKKSNHPVRRIGRFWAIDVKDLPALEENIRLYQEYNPKSKWVNYLNQVT